MTGFSLRKKAAGVYFNDREMICSVQISKEHEDSPDEKLLSSIRGSRDVFFALDRRENLPSSLLRRLENVLGDIRKNTERRNKQARKRLAQGAGQRAAAGKSENLK